MVSEDFVHFLVDLGLYGTKVEIQVPMSIVIGVKEPVEL